MAMIYTGWCTQHNKPLRSCCGTCPADPLHSHDCTAGKMKTGHLLVEAASAAQGVSRRFPQTYCSHCGTEFGAGNHGFSHCENHKGMRAGGAHPATCAACMAEVAAGRAPAGPDPGEPAVRLQCVNCTREVAADRATCDHCGSVELRPFAKPRFAAVPRNRAGAIEGNPLPHGVLLMQGDELVAVVRSHTMAKRIANALNTHKPNREGV